MSDKSEARKMKRSVQKLLREYQTYCDAWMVDRLSPSKEWGDWDALQVERAMWAQANGGDLP